MQTRNNLLIILFLTAAISLFGTITNFLPLSVFFVWLVVLIPLLIRSQNSYHQLLISVLLVYIYFIVSTALYNFSALGNVKFYRRDGNFFIAFLPILLFGMFCLRFKIENIIDKFLLFATAVNLCLIALYLLGFSVYPVGLYNHLFFAHNAAGGFLSVLLCISIGCWYCRKNKILFALVVINAIGLLLTDSKGTILAVMGALFIHFLCKEKKITLLLSLYTLILFAFLIVIYPYWMELGKFYIEDNIDIEWGIQDKMYDRQHTLLIRALALWPRAFYLWLHSPIFGTGFGSYNDVPYEFPSDFSLAQFNASGKYIYSDAHAHHSFLHVLAETGVVGLALVIFMLYQIWKFVQNLDSSFLRHSLLLIFWTAILSSFTEHRLFTLSQMLPFTIILGLTLGNHRSTYLKAYAT